MLRRDEHSQIVSVAFAVMASFCPAMFAEDPKLDPAGLGKFVRLPLDAQVTNMAAAEDGELLAAAHLDENFISICDVKTATFVKKLEALAPAALLWRGGRLYVGHRGQGPISVFDPRKNWELVDQLQTGARGVHYLSAPQREFFKGYLLATGWGAGEKGETVLVLIDANQDRRRELIRATGFGVGTVDYEGRYYFTQASNDMAVHLTYDFALAIEYFQASREEDPAPDYQTQPQLMRKYFHSMGAGNEHSGAFFYQTWNDRFWLGGSWVFRGTPPRVQRMRMADQEHLERRPSKQAVQQREKATTLGGRLIPDIRQRVLYVLEQNKMRCLDVERGFAEAGSQPVEPSSLHKPVDTHDFAGLPQWKYFNPSFAVAHDPFVMFYLYDSEQKAIFHCRLNSFAASLEAAKTTTPAGPVQTVPAVAGIHALEGQIAKVLAYSRDGRGVLLLDRNTLHILDADGQKIVRSHRLHQYYAQIYERPDYYVAINEVAVDLLDKETLAVKKSMELPSRDSVVAMVPHPTQRISYVSMTVSGHGISLLDESYVLEIDESTGAISKLPNVYSRSIGVDPQGRYLFGFLLQAWGHGARTERPGIFADKNFPDVVMTYDLTRRLPIATALTSEAGKRGKRFTFSPDGQQVAFLTWNGQGANISSFPVGPLSKPEAAYSMKGNPVDLSFHPTLDLVAATSGPGFATTGQGVSFFDRHTGKELSNRIDPNKVLGSINRLLFTPGGRHLLVAHSGKTPDAVVEALPLTLQGEEEAIVAKGFKPPQPAQPAVDWDKPRVDADLSRVPLDKLEALTFVESAEMTSTAIADKFGTSVVDIDYGGSRSAGIVIGSSGYILTTADLFMLFGQPTVSYQVRTAGVLESKKLKGALVKFDSATGLALLKIDPEAPMISVRFARAEEAIAGQPLTVVGRDQSKDPPAAVAPHSTQVVKSANTVGGISYIEAQRVIDDANGSPAFNNQGQMLGMVVVKPKLELQQLILPLGVIQKFLEPTQDAKPESSNPAFRLWSDDSGKFQVEAELVRLGEDLVVLKCKSGETISVPLSRLSANDREYLRNREKP